MKIALPQKFQTFRLVKKRKKESTIALPILDFRSKKRFQGRKNMGKNEWQGIVSRSDYQKTACFAEISSAGGVRPVITSRYAPPTS